MRHYAIKTCGVNIFVLFILDMGTIWMGMLSSTSQPLCLRWQNSRCSFHWALCWPQQQTGRCGKEKNLAHAGIRNSTPQPSRLQTVALPTGLSRFIERSLHFKCAVCLAVFPNSVTNCRLHLQSTVYTTALRTNIVTCRLYNVQSTLASFLCHDEIYSASAIYAPAPSEHYYDTAYIKDYSLQ